MSKKMWDYRIIENSKKYCLLHIVYYNEEGEIVSWSKNGIGAYGESYNEIVDDLRNLNYKVLILEDGKLVEKEDINEK